MFAPFMTPSPSSNHTTPSLAKVVLRASFPSLLFPHCDGLQLKFPCLPGSLSMFLLLLVIIFSSIHAHCSHSCWSIFHPSASCPCLTCTNPSVSLSLASLTSFSSSPQAPLLLSSRNVKSSAVTLEWLKPTLVPKKTSFVFLPPLQLVWLHSDPA